MLKHVAVSITLYSILGQQLWYELQSSKMMDWSIILSLSNPSCKEIPVFWMWFSLRRFQISISYTWLRIAPQGFVNSKKRNNKQCLFKCTQYGKYLQCFGKQLISALLEELPAVYLFHPRKVPNTQTFMEGNDSIFFYIEYI